MHSRGRRLDLEKMWSVRVRGRLLGYTWRFGERVRFFSRLGVLDVWLNIFGKGGSCV